MASGEVDGDGFNQSLGDRLRLARRSRGWSLSEVETISDGEFKASVVGAYERGERSLTVQRLVRLAATYDVPLDSLLPRPSEPSDTMIDLTAPDLDESHDGALIDRYLGTIQMMRRGDPRELAIRSSDLRLLSSMLSEERLSSMPEFEDR